MIFLVGCETTKIGDINRDPGRYAGKDVAISGQATESFGVLNEGAFEVDDGTGRIWVLSEGFGVPGKGARSEEHTSELQSLRHLVCRLLLEKKKSSHQRKGLQVSTGQYCLREVLGKPSKEGVRETR